MVKVKICRRSLGDTRVILSQMVDREDLQNLVITHPALEELWDFHPETMGWHPGLKDPGP